MSNVWKLVPVKPTPKMIHAMDACNPSPFWKGDVYAAMLAAAPQVAPDVEALQARIAELERQQAVLVDAIYLALIDIDETEKNGALPYWLEGAARELRAALAAVKPAGQKGGE